ncbi:Uncharacterized protein TCM_019722 [Theobroma cacao]|uniref:Uncharacterized protein n=1 Tax=Theobroma cacao TaxID=3641 RepID=A0A061EHI5_THECC|nr:Uncharacterized protein TCM_019722 [Theobroma cacao]
MNLVQYLPKQKSKLLNLVQFVMEKEIVIQLDQRKLSSFPLKESVLSYCHWLPKKKVCCVVLFHLMKMDKL